MTQVALVVNNPPANAGDVTGMGSIPGLGRSPGGGHDNPLQHSCLENPRDRRAWRATVYRVAKSRTRLKRLSTHTQCCDPVNSSPRNIVNRNAYDHSPEDTFKTHRGRADGNSLNLEAIQMPIYSKMDSW